MQIRIITLVYICNLIIFFIELVLIGAHLTGIKCEEAQKLIWKLDIITGCASLMVRTMIHPVLQAGISVPVFALMQKGKELIIERAKEIDSPILVSTEPLLYCLNISSQDRSDNEKIIKQNHKL